VAPPQQGADLVDPPASPARAPFGHYFQWVQRVFVPPGQDLGGVLFDEILVDLYGRGETGKELHVMIGAKVFSATKARERENLGETVTAWIRQHQELKIIDKIVTQSSDSEFHCLTVTLFYQNNKKPSS
jgi:hypothetical protein